MAKKPQKKPADSTVATETGKDIKPIKRWLSEIDKAKRQQKPWVEKCEAIVSRYKDERAESKASKEDRKYNALWSMMQTLMPLTYASPPKPYISRRFDDSDPVGRDAAELLQRNLSYAVENEALHDSLEDANEDFNLTSRAVIWNRYSPLFSLRASEDKTYVEPGSKLPEGMNEDELDEDDKGSFYNAKVNTKVDEEMDIDHVLYKHMLHGAASKWRYVPWVARMVAMTRAKMIERFGEEKGKKPPLTLDCDENSSKKEATDDEKGFFAKAEVWEVWCKEDRKVYWLCPGYADDFLDVKDDPLELDGFFPCPRPAYGTKTNDSLTPTPDYVLWQDIALELDDLTLRIKLLTEALRVVGIYDSQLGDMMKRIVTHTQENDMIPVDSYAMLQEKGGLKNAVEFFPIDQVVGVLDKLQMRRTVLVQELYEITGVSDVIRGASDPNETLGAQKLKGNYANKRLGKRQDKIARMARENLEIMAQIICNHYSDDTIMRISSASEWMKDEAGQFDVARFQAAIQLLRVGMLRRFRIKIDERSLAAQDLEEDRNDRMMFLQSVSQLITGFAQMSQQFPGGKKLMATLLMFGIRAFPMARTTEAEFETALKAFTDQPETPPEQEQQAPEKPGKTEQEIANDTMKAQAAMRRVDVMMEDINRKREDDQRDFTAKMKALEQKWAEFQTDSQLHMTKISTDATLQQQAHANTREQMQHQHQQEENRLARDVTNDRMSAVQAFASPPARGQRAA